MYIKSIVLDGFKSYGQRTEIVGFDQLFNAITGLNGSGKSNILDAICFVLGLSNMSLARCTTLRELIFKNGQAGVHKAIVTVTFDNSDKGQSPTGYEHHREIVIRREVHLNSRTKYYVCGQSASNQQVSDLFHSVQLNISNPHFLIMQGRITKVLNMKPQEILSMVEEATGVSMYETKKRSTQVMIEKKDAHLRAIDLLINETILPKLDQLRREHANLLDYQNLVGELDSISKRVIAWRFVQNRKKAQASAAKVEQCENNIAGLKVALEEYEEEQQKVEEDIHELETKKDEMSGGQIIELERSLKAQEKVEISILSELEKKTDRLNQEKIKKKDLEDQLKNDRQLMQAKIADCDDFRKEFEKIKSSHEQIENEYERAQRNYEAISTGKALNEEGEAAASLADQLLHANNEVASAKTDLTIATNRLALCEKELSSKKKEAEKYKALYQADIDELGSMEQVVTELKSQIDALNYSESAHNQLNDERIRVKKDLESIKFAINQEESSDLRFDYNDPCPNFNRSSVKGLVCKLFTVKDKKYARAIDTAAGVKLYFIVTDNEQTSKLLLERGNLRRSFNFIPINKIKGKRLDKNLIERARGIVKDQEVYAAIDLVEFHPSLLPAMEFVFGDTIITTTLDKARSITNDKQIQRRTITLDGDYCMTGGTMAGGAPIKTESILIKIIGLKEKYKAVEELKENLKRLEEKLRKFDELRKIYLPLMSEYNVKSGNLIEVKNRMQLASKHHQLFDDVKKLIEETQQLEISIKCYGEIRDKSSKKAEELKFKLENSDQFHKKQMETAQNTLKTIQKKLDQSKKVLSQKKGKVESLSCEIETLEKSCQAYVGQIEAVAELIEDLEVELKSFSKEVDHVKATLKDVSDLLKKHKAKLHEQSGEINKLVKKKSQIANAINQKRLEIKKVEHEIEKIQNEAKDAANCVKTMLIKDDWINEEMHLFGKDNSNYAFHRKDFDIKQLEARLAKLQETKITMQKSVNQRANLLLSDKEKEAEDLRNKRSIVEADKDKLIAYMEEVDQKKAAALHKAWQKINIDFDSIFSTFLPGTHAKLDIPSGKNLLDGLEVKVAFGDVWKESLTELSGGQRSLVALSLILALLKYNPAPVYILDEVDAALDQNHTQNTGTMIKKHFNRSQFIIVSLKDDMFRNANVLFKTKFVDGKSTVARYTHGQKS